MPWIHQGVIRQTENLVVYAVIQLSWVPHLKISSTATANQQGITGKNPVSQKVADTAIGMSRCVACLDIQRAYSDVYPVVSGFLKKKKQMIILKNIILNY